MTNACVEEGKVDGVVRFDEEEMKNWGVERAIGRRGQQIINEQIRYVIGRVVPMEIALY